MRSSAARKRRRGRDPGAASKVQWLPDDTVPDVPATGRDRRRACRCPRPTSAGWSPAGRRRCRMSSGGSPRGCSPAWPFAPSAPPGSGWLRGRLADVPISCGVEVAEAREHDGQVTLRLADGSSRTVDHVLVGTGYRVASPALSLPGARPGGFDRGGRRRISRARAGPGILGAGPAFHGRGGCSQLWPDHALRGRHVVPGAGRGPAGGRPAPAADQLRLLGKRVPCRHASCGQHDAGAGVRGRCESGGGLGVVRGAGRAAAASHALPRAAVSGAAATDCTIFSGSPTSNAQCGGGSDDTVGTDGNGAFYRTMMSFTNLGIPAGSTITGATLQINVLGAFGSTAATVVDMTRAFAPGAATWNTYDGVHPWTTAGGDSTPVRTRCRAWGARARCSSAFPIWSSRG